MTEKLEEQLKNYRLNLYKGLVISLSDDLEFSHRISKHLIDKECFIAALEKFIEIYNLEDISADLKNAIHDYWNKIKMQNGGKLSKFKSKAFLFVFKLRRIEYSFVCPEAIIKINTIRKLITFLSDESKDLFTDFDILRDIFEDMPLSKSEKASIFAHIVTLNSERILSKDYNLPINEEYIKKQESKRLSVAVLKHLIDYKGLEEFLNGNPKKLKWLRKQAIKLNQENPYDITDLAANCHIIKNGMNSGKLDEDEYRTLAIPCFVNLGFADLYQTLAYKTSEKYLEQDEKPEVIKSIEPEVKEEQTEDTPVIEPVVTENEETLSNKELKQMRRKINEIYDFDENICLKTISMDDIVECIAILLILKCDMETIKKFIFTAEKKLKQNPYVAYREFMDKIMSTVSDPLALEYLEELRNLIESKPSVKVLEQAKENASRCIRYINRFIDDDYTYEINLAKNKVKELTDGKSRKSL